MITKVFNPKILIKMEYDFSKIDWKRQSTHSPNHYCKTYKNETKDTALIAELWAAIIQVRGKNTY